LHCILFFLDEGTIDVAVKSIARTYHWTPFEIMKLYADNIDMYGLFFWYNDARDMEREMAAKNK
jgi:hypothetical protein